MKKLNVFYSGWGEHWQLGTLAQAGTTTLFEYTPLAIERNLVLSPIHHPLPHASGAVSSFKGSTAFHGLPGFIADALPDGWGMLLMDRALRQAGRDPRTVSVIERLALIGHSAVGALSFEPSEETMLPGEVLQLSALIRDVRKFLAQDRRDGEPGEAGTNAILQQLLRLGGSPQGARPKVLVDFNPRTGAMSSGLPRRGAMRPWLVKFPAPPEHREVSALEQLYALFARCGGIEMPISKCFEVGKQHSAFGVSRFDRVVAGTAPDLRVPMVSLGGLLEADHRIPSLDYESYLLATLRLTGDQREVRKAFERCVFNVLMHNRDDHARNFAYVRNRQGHWVLSPAFDLTFSNGPGGEHSTSVAGHGKQITRAHLLRVAKIGGIKLKDAEHSIDHWRNLGAKLTTLAKSLPIRRATLARVFAHVSAQGLLLQA